MSKKTYENRKKQGICVKCGKENAMPEKTMCFKCAEKVREYHRQNREFFKSIGLCARCGKNKVFGDEKECLECRAMMYELNLKSKERRNLSNKDYYQRDIQRLKENGICRGCRKRKVAENRTYCEHCLIVKRERSRKYRKMISRSGLERNERPSYGLCYTCGFPLDREGRVCKKCSKKMTQNLPRIRCNEYWREQNKLLVLGGN